MYSLANKTIHEGLTFDDVLLIPARSEVLPREVDVSTYFSRNIKISSPIVSAAMDTVTEAAMAIEMAREGGIGIIHKNMPIEIQMEHVRKVKRAENGMIYDPITIHKDSTVGNAQMLMKENKIGGIPVVDEKGRLIGIVTNRDLRFIDNPKTLIEEVMTKENLITAVKGTDLQQASAILKRYKIEKLPVVDENRVLIGLLTFKDITKIKDNPNASKDEKGRLRVGAAVGVGADTILKVEKLLSVGTDAVVIDTAHGHSVYVL
ncbi:MAG TPA: IMP dehydrogenase, partial [Bacteroidales bacterium]|nr:IMP dehydrogenase [Bacteroidales bacterium]